MHLQTMPSKCTVSQRDIVNIEISSLEMPSKSGTGARVLAEEPKPITHLDVHARWVEEDREEDREEPQGKKENLLGHEHSQQK